jgi:hypothetical protein
MAITRGLYRKLSPTRAKARSDDPLSHGRGAQTDSCHVRGFYLSIAWSGQESDRGKSPSWGTRRHRGSPQKSPILGERCVATTPSMLIDRRRITAIFGHVHRREVSFQIVERRLCKKLCLISGPSPAKNSRTCARRNWRRTRTLPSGFELPTIPTQDSPNPVQAPNRCVRQAWLAGLASAHERRPVCAQARTRFAGLLLRAR